MTTFVGSEAVGNYQKMVVKAAIKMQLDHGMRPNRYWTNTRMLKAVSKHTGKTYKRGKAGLREALADLED
jgi:hypothetical protein